MILGRDVSLFALSLKHTAIPYIVMRQQRWQRPCSLLFHYLVIVRAFFHQCLISILSGKGQGLWSFVIFFIAT